MNIIFEGIDASGKTTLLNETLKVLIEKGEKAEYIREIGNTPLQLLLNDMLSKDLFFQSKEKFNTSIYKFYTDERLKRATYLIQKTEIPIKEIAFICGFNDYNNFSKAFKKKYNYPPSALKRDF